MKKLFIIVTTLCGLLMYLVSCTSSPIAGNGTRIGNPSIAGMIYKPDGKTPAPNATVFLRKKNSLPEIGLKKQASDIAIVTTDDDGRFEIDSVANGTYVIECNDRDDNYALYDSVEVENSDTTINLPADTLKPAGAISGTIILPEGGDFGRIYALVFGVQRFSIVDSSGHFRLENLAEGHYDLRIISSLGDYDNFDTTKVTIFSGETTSVIFELSFTGIPPVKNLSIQHYDTSSRIVTLSWGKIDTSLIKGYYVYRKVKYQFSEPQIMGLKNAEYMIDTFSTFSVINRGRIITDTIFRDSFAYQNQTYTYVVTTIGKDSKLNEIPFTILTPFSKEMYASNEVSVTIKTHFSTDTLFERDFGDFRELKGCNPGKFVYTNGTFYLITNNEVRLYDTMFNQTGIWNNFALRPFEIAADKNGRIYVSIINSTNHEVPGSITSINIFDNNGTVIKKFNLNDSLDSIPALGIYATLFSVSDNGNIILVNSTKDSIYICDSTGSILKKVSCGVEFNTDWDPKIYQGITTLATDNNNNIYAFDINTGIKVYSEEGIQARVITPEYSDLTNQIEIDHRNGNIYLITMRIAIYSPEDQKITSFSFVNGEAHHVVLAGNKIYALSGTANTTSIYKLSNNLP